jgi:TatA/E family protein of Tat protein translocase
MGITEILVVSGIIVLIWGGSRIPSLMKAMGEAKTAYKRSLDGKEDS